MRRNSGKRNVKAVVRRTATRDAVDAVYGILRSDRTADDWLTDYNEFRPHESLGNVPPAVFKPRVFNAKVSTSELST